MSKSTSRVFRAAAAVVGVAALGATFTGSAHADPLSDLAGDSDSNSNYGDEDYDDSNLAGLGSFDSGKLDFESFELPSSAPTDTRTGGIGDIEIPDVAGPGSGSEEKESDGDDQPLPTINDIDLGDGFPSSSSSGDLRSDGFDIEGLIDGDALSGKTFGGF